MQWLGYLLDFRCDRMEFFKSWTFGGLAKAPRFKASSGENLNFNGSFAHAGKCFNFGILVFDWMQLV